MTAPSSTWSDDDLARAVAAARSWRGVLRELGVVSTSAAAISSVRRRAAALGLDHGHFTGRRTWTDKELLDAVACSTGWPDVADVLGLARGSSTTVLKGHAVRLGIDATHFGAARPQVTHEHTPSLDRLPHAGSMLAAAWFALCGYEVMWPLEPCPYDLLAQFGDVFLRVQVKTTRMRVGDGWRVKVSTSGRGSAPYDPDELNYFFVIDGDLAYYLIPASVLGGRQAVFLNSYQDYRVATAPPAPSPATAAATTCPPPRTDEPGSA